ncbi:hypothetical protein DPMN_181969 [Dreissena polymorpha]|uniref:Uncharacterized protein n=1 Tax=Dreissena polymorpha TaxID=45954 RepID=A0A9D4DDB4_DREPO|nr:hypothetical protein DPMN_181969 [Dreissena polymorpha]
MFPLTLISNNTDPFLWDNNRAVNKLVPPTGAVKTPLGLLYPEPWLCKTSSNTMISPAEGVSFLTRLALNKIFDVVAVSAISKG